MYDLYSMEVIIRERQQSILDEVTRNRTARNNRPAGPGISQQLSTRIGDAFITLGNRLKRRYASDHANSEFPACDGKACA